MSVRWIRRMRCAWRARRLLSNIALLTDAYCGLANRLDDGFNEDTFTDAYHMRHVIDTRLGELEAYLTAGTLPDRWHAGRRELVSDGLAAADELMDKARTRYNEMVLLEYEANGMDANLLEHARRIMAGTDELLGGIEVMRPGEEQQVVTPARTERVLVTPARTVQHPAVTHAEPVYETQWVDVYRYPDGYVVSGRAPTRNEDIQHGDPSIVAEPRQIQTGTRTVVDKAAWTETIPAQYDTKIIPAVTKTVHVPAQYETVTIVDEPAKPGTCH